MSIIITLEPELEKYIEEKVRSGEFANPSEVVDGAFAALHKQEELDREDTEELRREVQVGIDAMERGDSAPWNVEEMKAELRDRIGHNAR